MSAWGGWSRRFATLTLFAGIFAVALGLGALVNDAGAGRPAKKGGLTAKERRALEIVSVRANGADRTGLLVTVTFKGNIEKALGRRHLKQALVAVLVHPADGRPAIGVATRRAGSIGDTLTNVKSARRVGVLRNRRELSFLISGVSVGDDPGIEVKAFASSPLRSPRRAGASSTAQFWEQLDQQIARDEEVVREPELKYRRCRHLQGWAGELEAMLKRAKDREADLDKARREFEKAIPELESALTLGQFARAGNIIVAMATGAVAPFTVLFEATPAAPAATALLLLYAKTLHDSVYIRDKNQALRDAIRGLKLDVRLADAYIAKNRALIENARQVLGEAKALAGVVCVPPTVSPIHAVFDEATRTTVYTVDATGADLEYSWAVSITADPPCATGFKPNTPKPNQATWEHADTEEGGKCSHKAYDAAGSGHPGTVYASVYNNSWRCRLTFTGTQGPTGAATADGPAPEPCELK